MGLTPLHLLCLLGLLPLDTVHASPLAENVTQLPLDNVDAAAAASAEVQQLHREVQLHRGYCCPISWFSFNGHCYKYVSTHMTWAEAEWNCVCQGANLVSVHSAGENNFVRTLIEHFDPREAPTWIGLSDLHWEGRWLWSDGSEVSFTMWADGEPNNYGGNENCVAQGGDYGPAGKWNDVPCHSSTFFDPIPSVCKSRTVSC